MPLHELLFVLASRTSSSLFSTSSKALVLGVSDQSVGSASLSDSDNELSESCVKSISLHKPTFISPMLSENIGLRMVNHSGSLMGAFPLAVDFCH